MPMTLIHRKTDMPAQAEIQDKENGAPVILSGFFGFAFALCAAVLSLCQVSQVFSGFQPIYGAFITLAILAFFLLLVAALNDFLIKEPGRRAIVAVAFLGGMSGSIGLLFSWTPGSAIFFSLLVLSGVVALIMVWGYFLSSRAHRLLLFITAIGFIITGLLSVLFLQFNSNVISALIIMSCLVSWICYSVIKRYTHIDDHRVTKGDSKERSKGGKGNRFTLMAVGLMLGCSACIIIDIDLPMNTGIQLLGINIIAAGVIVFALRRSGNSKFEDLARRSIGFFMALGLLPIPFVPTQVRAVFASILFCAAIINTILIVDAVAETARFNVVSPLWIIGIEGAFFILGAACGMTLFEWGLSMTQPSSFIIYLCLGFPFIFSILQVFIENQSYPFLSTDRGEEESEQIDEDLLFEVYSVRGGAVWRSKLDAVARYYGLSPRQIEVMRLLAKGRDTKFIMDYFVISHSTAKSHIYNLYRKLEVHSRQELLDCIESIDIKKDGE